MVKVSYRPGLEHAHMKAPGGLRYSLGTRDGLSKPYVWNKANGHTVDMTEADAKVMQKHLENGGLAVVEEYDFLTGESVGKIPTFLIGEAETKKVMDDFGKRYGAYAAYAAELAAADSDDLPMPSAGG